MTANTSGKQGDDTGPLARTPEEWRAWAENLGERPYRGMQIFKWLHDRKQLDPQGMTDLPKHIRSLLAPAVDSCLPVVQDIHQAADGTRKLVLRAHDGAIIESVLLPMNAEVHREEEATEDDAEEDVEQDTPGPSDRVTQCVSTQVGCAMRCAFCASGAQGLRRHLSPDEIVAQVLLGNTLLLPNQRLTNVTLMGMGELLHNYDATVRAVRVMQRCEGLGLSSRRITISTVGLVPEIHRLSEDFQGRIGLAVSLHAADDPVRTRIVPTNKRYPLGALMSALRQYPLPPRRRLTIECALIEGVNDSDRMARALVTLLRGLRVKVNLIPMNPVPHSRFLPSSAERVVAFQQILTRAGVSCFIRKRRGDDVSAACGQLAGNLARNGHAVTRAAVDPGSPWAKEDDDA